MEGDFQLYDLHADVADRILGIRFGFGFGFEMLKVWRCVKGLVRGAIPGGCRNTWPTQAKHYEYPKQPQQLANSFACKKYS